MNCRSKYLFNRVSQDLPCPICGKTGWCMISQYGERSICCRVESDWPAPSYQGWYHPLPPRGRPAPARIAAATQSITPHGVRDFTEPHRLLVSRFGEPQRQRVAAALGLDVRSLEPYPLGFDQKLDALAIPAMQLDPPTIVGIRYRRINPRPEGLKWSCEPGSTAGLLLPCTAPTSTEPIVVCEGPSDTFAANQIALHAVGRWSCGLDGRQVETLKAHVAAIARPKILVVGDNDAALTGRHGADTAAQLIAKAIPHALVQRVQPPVDIKDLREWVMNGATAADILGAGSEARHGS